jgi:hypothetical protein
MNHFNCDQVFDVLTRGPFPTGDASDREVERHLACCHECRALAEALRPAVELFHESISPEESRDLPGYHGAASTSGGGLAQLVAAAIAAEAPRANQLPAPRARREWVDQLAQPVTRFALATTAGALLALALWTFGIMESERPGGAVAAIRPTEAGLVQLVSLELPARCFSLPAAEASTLHCCTECHKVGVKEPRLAERSLALVASSCRACHEQAIPIDLRAASRPPGDRCAATRASRPRRR